MGANFSFTLFRRKNYSFAEYYLKNNKSLSDGLVLTLPVIILWTTFFLRTAESNNKLVTGGDFGFKLIFVMVKNTEHFFAVA